MTLSRMRFAIPSGIASSSCCWLMPIMIDLAGVCYLNSDIQNTAKAASQKKVLAIFLSRIVTFGSGFCKQLFAFLENMYYLSSFCLFDNLIVSEDFVYNHNLP